MPQHPSVNEDNRHAATVPVRIAVLLSKQSSLALALLLRDVFLRANRLLLEERYKVELVTSTGVRSLQIGDASVTTRRIRGAYDYVIAVPFDRFTGEQVPEQTDVQCVRAQREKGAIVASACLGALTLAAAGVLDGKDATTHWAWTAHVRNLYPKVNWCVGRMISDEKEVITAGGYLATVDLALYIVGATSKREIAHRLGQSILADSVRQKQSVYARTLIEPAVEHGTLSELARWIERHLDGKLGAESLARRCNMSLRTFHRRFVAAHGATPRKFIQIKRIERAQELLRTTSKSIDEIIGRVGVSDPVSFRRVFQRELGYSPAEFRRKLRRDRVAHPKKKKFTTERTEVAEMELR
jgi:AraC family transcriptional activator FtrA